MGESAACSIQKYFAPTLTLFNIKNYIKRDKREVKI